MKTTLALSAVAGLAAAGVALASPGLAVLSATGSAGDTVHNLAVSGYSVTFGQAGGPPLRPCRVIDLATPSTSHEAGHVPVKQVLPLPGDVAC